MGRESSGEPALRPAPPFLHSKEGMESTTHTRRPHAPSVGLSAVRALTLNHRVAGFDSLARHALPMAGLAAARQLLHQAGLEAVLLSTCNRTELYWHTRGDDDDRLAVAI